MTKKHTQKIVGIGVFAAFAYVVMLICQVIPPVGGFLSIDAKDTVIAIASFIYGPLVAPIISLFVAFFEFITVSSTGIWGFVMNFASSTVFSLTASLIYTRKKSINMAILGFFAAIVTTTAVMLFLNPIIVPLYSGVSREVVISMIPTLLLPFNFSKALLNGAFAMLLYKPIIVAMRKAKIIPAGEYKTTFNKTTVVAISVGVVWLISSIIIFFVIW